MVDRGKSWVSLVLAKCYFFRDIEPKLRIGVGWVDISPQTVVADRGFGDQFRTMYACNLVKLVIK